MSRDEVDRREMDVDSHPEIEINDQLRLRLGTNVAFVSPLFTFPCSSGTSETAL